MPRPRYSVLCASALCASAIVLVLLHACGGVEQATTSIEAQRIGAINTGKIALSYVCDNKFRVTNANPSAATVTYKVVNTAEQGTLNLPAKPKGAGPSETLFSTQNTGTVELYIGVTLIASQTNNGVSCTPQPPPPPPPPPPPAPPPEATVGQWSAVFPAPIVQLHLHLNLDGTVLGWGHDGDPQVWNPATGAFTPVPSPSLMFCSGHNFLPDGRLLVAGGHITDGHGLPNTNVFDAGTDSWFAGSTMAQGRWYPTNTTLPNGEVVTVAGTDEGGATVTIPEVWNGSSWRQLTGASLSLPYYPRDFVAPDGKIFYAGEQQQSRYLDVSGTGSWTNGPMRQFGTRDYGSAVMYEPGKILYVGGGPPTNTAEIIDLNVGNPQWSFTGSMQFARRQMNATVLPDGQVLVTGGTSGGGFNSSNGAVHAAELWNPVSGAWTTMASNAVTRIYHSTTLLLPDARVLHTGSGDASGATDELSYEIYSPPYLFKGPRPTMTSATPPKVGYGQTLSISTPDNIAKVSFIRFGSVTHAFDTGTRLVPLSFSQVSGVVTVVFPANGNIAPPGPYMLFFVNGNGVPSVSRIMLLN